MGTRIVAAHTGKWYKPATMGEFLNELLRALEERSKLVDAVVALLALLISFVSILLTVIALYLQRQHNYKSLTPIVSFPVSDYENKIAVNLKNTGVGPLIVASLRVTDGRETKDDIISWMPELPEGVYWETFYAKADGACVPAGSALVLLKLSGDPGDQAFASARDSCRKVLGSLKISIAYKDIYDRMMPSTEKDLSWFGRHLT